MRNFVRALITLLLLTPTLGNCNELHLIDGQPVLLYKIINWWGDCLDNLKARGLAADALPKAAEGEPSPWSLPDCRRFCGSELAFRMMGGAQITYDPGGGRLRIRFAPWLERSLATPGEEIPPEIRSSWLNPAIFPQGEGLLTDGATLFSFRGVSEESALGVTRMGVSLGVVLRGRIVAMRAGTIVLGAEAGAGAPDGRPENSGQGAGAPSVSLVNLDTEEVLAEFPVDASPVTPHDVIPAQGFPEVEGSPEMEGSSEGEGAVTYWKRTSAKRRATAIMLVSRKSLPTSNGWAFDGDDEASSGGVERRGGAIAILAARLPFRTDG